MNARKEELQALGAKAVGAADAAMAEALRKQAGYHDAMATYHAIRGNALSAVRYREMAQSSREMAVQWQSWADEGSEKDAA